MNARTRERLPDDLPPASSRAEIPPFAELKAPINAAIPSLPSIRIPKWRKRIRNTIPPPGYVLIKKTELIMVGDRIMTSNRPGEWMRPIEDRDHLILGHCADSLATMIDTQVKAARRLERKAA